MSLIPTHCLHLNTWMLFHSCKNQQLTTERKINKISTYIETRRDCYFLCIYSREVLSDRWLYITQSSFFYLSVSNLFTKQQRNNIVSAFSSVSITSWTLALFYWYYLWQRHVTKPYWVTIDYWDSTVSQKGLFTNLY